MTETRPAVTGVYRFTSMGRPIDPAYLTNRWLLIVLPVLAVLSAAIALLVDTGVSPLPAALNGALVAFAAWALTRELAPDSNGAAFVALAFAWAANIAFGTRQVMLVFLALLLVRIVNRSTGLPSRLLDTLGVLGFAAWAAFSTQQPLLLLVASLAFALDGMLEKPLRRHYLAAAACLAAFVWMLLEHTNLFAGNLLAWDWLLLGAIAFGVILIVRSSPAPVSYCDTSPERLDRTRVNGGLIVGGLVATQALVTGGRSAWLETPIWVCMLAVLVFSLVRRPGSQGKAATAA